MHYVFALVSFQPPFMTDTTSLCPSVLALPLSLFPALSPHVADLPPLPEDGSECPTAMSPGSPCSVTGTNAANDLRFHQLHGTNAVITNGGRTALRQNCRSEFNDAIVISNRSGNHWNEDLRAWKLAVCEVVVM